jgi:hypothetical protein
MAVRCVGVSRAGFHAVAESPGAAQQASIFANQKLKRARPHCFC